MTTKATQIIISDDSEQDRESGDEQHVFYVFTADDDGDAIGRVYTKRSEQGAIYFAQNLSDRSGLPFGWD